MTKLYYRYFDRLLVSNVALPHLTENKVGDPDVLFEWRTTELHCRGALKRIYHCHGGSLSGLEFFFERDDEGHWVRFPGIACFKIFHQGKKIACHPLSNSSRRNVLHLALNMILPLTVTLFGRQVFHASCVGIGSRAVLFLGKSGAGKSTLAASFGRQGCRLLTDDCLVLEPLDDRFVAIPGYASLRLWRDSVAHLLDDEASAGVRVSDYCPKKSIDLSSANIRSHPASLPVERIYVLAELEKPGRTVKVNIRKLGLGSAFQALLEAQFRLDIRNKQLLADEFFALGQVASALTVCELAYPRDFSYLPRVRQAVLEDLGETIGGT